MSKAEAEGVKRTGRTKWFTESRFGMFIHWGLYSIPAMDEWIQSIERIPPDTYEKYSEQFHPDLFDAAEWAKLAKKAGMKYAVLTARHHDGFCLFDTKYTDFNSVQTTSGRDFVREFLEAFRAEGIRVGLYYSLLDWHHPDYPHYGDLHHPMRDNEAWKGREHNWDRYLAYMHGQIEELVTNYGKLDIMWFDFSYDDMRGEKWGASKIVETVRRHQPDIILDNRMEGGGTEHGSLMTAHPNVYSGDFLCPEQMIPPEPLVNELGEPVPWEACLTLNKHWGYSAHDRHFKSARLLIRTLVQCVSMGGNLIVNVGPDARGRIPGESVSILSQVGGFMELNGESIYGCGPAGLPKPDWGRFTRKGNRIYAHILEESVSAYCLPPLDGRIGAMRRLSDGGEVRPADFWTLRGYKDRTFFFCYPDATDCYPLPDEKDTVIEITVD